ncbi:trehalase-like domain-containing protein [Saccharothrix xinjiangensis]|uniref:Trehalase-like domain-containing protein n=1 Tax=Saccharothrix xinjiangensis TaxID=204798 RepID=A0ABV9Y9N2_9PSEU
MGTSEPMVLRLPGTDWEISSDGGQETATAVVRPREDAAIPPDAVLLHRRPVFRPPWASRSGAPVPTRSAQDWASTSKLPAVAVEPDLVLRSRS